MWSIIILSRNIYTVFPNSMFSYVIVKNFPQDTLLSKQNILYAQSIISIFCRFQTIQIPALEAESYNIRVGSDFEDNWVIICVLYMSVFGHINSGVSGPYVYPETHAKGCPRDGCLQGWTRVHTSVWKPPAACEAEMRKGVVPRSQISPGHHLPAQKSKSLRILNPNPAFQIVMTLYLSW